MGYSHLISLAAAIVITGIMAKAISPSIIDSIKSAKVEAEVISREKAVFEAVCRYISLEGALPTSMSDLLTKNYFPSVSNNNGFGGTYSFAIDAVKGTVTISTDIADSRARTSFINSYKNVYKPVQGTGNTVHTTFVLPTSIMHGNGQFMSGIPVQSTAPDASNNKYWYDTSGSSVVLKMSDGTNWKTVTSGGQAMLPTTSSLSSTSGTNGQTYSVVDTSTNTVHTYTYWEGNWYSTDTTTAPIAYIPPAPPAVVPSGFIKINGSENYSFAGVSPVKGWAVMKWEASYVDFKGGQSSCKYGEPYGGCGTGRGNAAITSQNSAAPINYITHDEAETLCQNQLKDSDGNAVSGGHLLGVALWHMIADNATQQTINWSGGAIGNGYLSRGYADYNVAHASNCQTGTVRVCPSLTSDPVSAPTDMYNTRAWNIGGGEWVSDFAGNVEEWYYETSTNYGSAYGDYSTYNYAFDTISLDPTDPAVGGVSYTTNGVGRALAINNGAILPGTTKAGTYGGNGSSNTNAGLFASFWSSSYTPTTRNQWVGFRCVIPIP